MRDTYWETMLAMCGEIGIGIAGFSAIIITLDIAKNSRFSRVDVLHLNVLLVSSGLAIFFSIFPLYLVEVGVQAPELWGYSAGAYFLLAGGIVVYRILDSHVVQSETKQLQRFILVGSLLMVSLGALNFLLWQRLWIHLAIVFWQLFIGYYVFTQILWGQIEDYE